MNYDRRVIDIVYTAVEYNLNKFKGIPLERYDNWKDDIIEGVQDYIQEIRDEKIQTTLQLKRIR